ncbi:MAG: metallopeptidase family protein [Actinomycetota bacterium]
MVAASSEQNTPRRSHRRDRRGRGLRGTLLPPHLPASRNRREEFGEYVLATIRRLEIRWSHQLSAVEFGVEDVPPSDSSPWEGTEVPLGRLFPAEHRLPARVVVYRRPIETRTEDSFALAMLIHHVVVEQLASLWGMDPDDVDGPPPRR